MYFGDGEVALGVSDLAGLEIDDPITFALLNAPQILLWELVSLRRHVVVD